MIIKFKKLHEDAIIPKYQTKGSAGFDFHSIEDVELFRGTVLVKTGLSIEIPEGYELQIRSRSGLAFKENIIVLNSPGTIDSDYRGEIGIILNRTIDGTKKSFSIKKGDRIAQGVICKIEQPSIEVVEKLSETERGIGGFGSTGK